MSWRMERRRVAAAIVGGNGNMAVTLAVIWVDVTTQSRALLRLLRLTALRAMKYTESNKCQRKALDTHQIPGLSSCQLQCPSLFPRRRDTTWELHRFHECSLLVRVHLSRTYPLHPHYVKCSVVTTRPPSLILVFLHTLYPR